MTPASSLLDPASNLALYTSTVLTLYVDLPDTPLRASIQDQRLAQRLFETGIPLLLVETALLLGTLRRLCRPSDVRPLPRIRSLAYFQPVIQELQEHPVPDGYLDYLRLKLRGLMDKGVAAGKLPAEARDAARLAALGDFDDACRAAHLVIEAIPEEMALKCETFERLDGLTAPETILAGIRAGSGGRATIVSDVGQHQMWIAKLYGYEERNSHITSGGLGTMGFAVPAAMGVHFARPDRPVWAISGDGGFQMNMQEMATMVQEGIPVKMAIFNNGYLGMVRQWQQFFHGRRYSATPIWSPDYVKLAEAYGIAGYRVEHSRQIEEAVDRAMRDPGPALVEFLIEQEANVFPMIPPGGSLSEPIESAPVAAPVP